MSVGTALHPRTAELNRKMVWREWAGYFAAGVYADFHDIEYNAIREAAALIDVSPLYKYEVAGPDAMRLVDRVITRDATKLAVDRVYYAPWCDEAGHVVDDGTIARLDETTYRWTAADPTLRWFRMNAAGLDVRIEDVSEQVAAIALQGPKAREVLEEATGQPFEDLRYFGRRASKIGRVTVDVTRTGYTGDRGYELWMDASNAVKVWDALVKAGQPAGLRPAGIHALDVCRIEAGLIMIEADYTSSRHALTPDQRYSPFELGFDRLVEFGGGDFVGRRALEAERAAGGPARRLAGVEIEWAGIEKMFAAQGLPPEVSATASRDPVPLYAGGRQVGKVTSHTWSPTLKQMIGLASVRAANAAAGSKLEMEWTVEGRRGRVPAVVTPLPFFDPPRKRS
ncbi:MAG TPA: aminomethyltransferase family protein [Actinomycetota bacterium]